MVIATWGLFGIRVYAMHEIYIYSEDTPISYPPSVGLSAVSLLARNV